MATLICPHCGMANRVGSNFCNNCGADLRATERPLPEDVEPSTGATEPSAEGADKAWTAGQPWLDVEIDADETAVPPVADAGLDSPQAAGRLIVGAQGLLPPLELDDQAFLTPQAPASPASTPAQADLARQLMTDLSAPVAHTAGLARARPQPGLRLPWLFWLLGLAVALPVFLLIREPAGTPHTWPGVRSAYRLVNELERNRTVLVYFAYDAATRGELDLVARPVMTHLLNRESHLVLVSRLPGGPAVARRLVASILFNTPTTALAGADSRLQIADQSLLQNVYLPGGVPALTLVGQDPLAAVSGTGTELMPAQRVLLEEAPALAVVFAAQAEAVQHWLEQAQPQNNVPVIAVTSAGADPALRPYLDSGQLGGLVSGFDGAESYEQLTGRSRTLGEETRARGRLAAQNWGHMALLLILLLGNLAGLLGRKA